MAFPLWLKSELLRDDRHGLNRNEAAQLATVDKLHPSGDFRVEGVVFAAADVQSGLEPGTALAHDDGSPGDYLTGENLDAKPLGIGVAAVFGAS
jgi:hypothetical protein